MSDQGEDLRKQPKFSVEDAHLVASRQFGIDGEISELPSERDQNFRIKATNGSFVLKIANPDCSQSFLELENQALRLAEAVTSFNSGQLLKSKDGQRMIQLTGEELHTWWVRCVSYVPGIPIAKMESLSPELLFDLGKALGELDLALAALNQSLAAKRDFKWDLANGPDFVRKTIERLSSQEQKNILSVVLARHQSVANRIENLPRSVIHNDANDYNIIVDVENEFCQLGFIDFGDMIYSATVNDLAICLAYVILDKENPLEIASHVIAGYHSSRSLSEDERSVLFELICMRLAQSVSIAQEQKLLQPDNEYLSITEKPAWEMLARLARIEPAAARLRFSDACHDPTVQNSAASLVTSGEFPHQKILELRKKNLSPSLSLSYERPLHIVRGKGQYLIDASDLTYLDCVNNVCHVGHCHPDVVNAATQQMNRLNTNTRYLHENIVRLASQLTATMPDGLDVCFFVNSGSEANDLAVRLARTFTGRHDLAAINNAYHGHVSTLIDISPYKFNSAGGSGKPEHVHIVPAPDGYRGAYKYDDPDFAKKYAEDAAAVIAKTGDAGIAAFFAESILSCGGQVPLPKGYLQKVYATVRNQGGVCVADEVQVGFGRVGTHFWGFQQHNVVPDIVTMGKPMGNGHPIAAVVTTKEIADAFHNGMEYFNTFGGNPVSCAIGLAVLETIEKEGLQKHALELGNWLLEQFNKLKDKHSVIGDVRGSGLFLGIEFVTDRTTLKPAKQLAKQIVNQMREQCILLSTDGPLENVIKFKPPMVFGQADAERVILVLDQVLTKLANEKPMH